MLSFVKNEDGKILLGPYFGQTQIFFCGEDVELNNPN